MTIDQIICNNLQLKIVELQKIIFNVEELFNYECDSCENKFNNEDKIILLYLLTYTKNNIEYDFYKQKIYIYVIIIYLNFKSEQSYLYIDEKYVNKIIHTILHSNIVSNLFDITDKKLNDFKELMNLN